MMKTSNDSIDLYKIAKQYVSNGLSVIPVNGKKPLVNWKLYQKRIPTKAELREWFVDSEATGVAIITGKISGLAVLDYEADANIPKDKLPDTVRAKSGGDGKHYYFKLPKNETIVSRNGFDHLTDLKAEGGYVVASPSLHQSGKRYKWIKDRSLFSWDLAELPQWVIDKYHNQVRLQLQEPVRVKPVKLGERNTYATKYAGKMLFHLPEHEWESFVWPLLLAWNNTNEFPLPEHELRSVFDSIANKERSKQQALVTTSNISAPISLSELVAEPDDEPDWLVDHIVPNGGTTILAGKAGNFKTWITLHLALAVASGTKLFGHFATVQSPVLIIDEENQKRTLRRRLQLLGYEDAENLFFWVQSGFKIDKSKYMKRLVRFINHKGIKLVIFDSFVRVHSKIENDAKEVAEIFAIVKELNRMGVTVLFTHHHRKQGGEDSGDTMRGSSDILAAVDAQLSVRANGRILNLQQNKLRDDEALLPFTVSVVVAEGSLRLVYDGESQPEPNKTDIAKSLILDLLEDGQKSRQKLVAELKEENIGDNKINDALKDLLQAKAIVGITGKHGTKTYRLIE
jgi:hypothetical protein